MHFPNAWCCFLLQITIRISILWLLTNFWVPLVTSTLLNSCRLWRISKEERLKLEQLVPLPICFNVNFEYESDLRSNKQYLSSSEKKACTGFESMTSAIPVQCSINISRSITEFLRACILSQKPNARNEIYKCLWESAEASYQHIVVRNVWAFSVSLNFR